MAQSNEKEAKIQINFPPENRAQLIYFLLWLPRVPSDENTRNRLITSCAVGTLFYVGRSFQRSSCNIMLYQMPSTLAHHRLKSIKKLILNFLCPKSIRNCFSNDSVKFIIKFFSFFLHSPLSDKHFECTVLSAWGMTD